MQVNVFQLQPKQQKEAWSRALTEMVRAACREEQQTAPQAAAILEIGLDDLTRSLAREGSGWWVAWANGQPVGLVRILPSNEPQGIYLAVLAGLYVKPEFRRQGIGSRLVTAAVRNAARRGYAAVRALVAEANPAMGLYHGLSFRVVRPAALPGYLVLELKTSAE